MQSKDISIGVNSEDNEIFKLRQRLEEHEILHQKIKSEFNALKQLNEEMNTKHILQINEMTEQYRTVKLDLRIAKRDADKTSEQIKYLRDEKKRLNKEVTQLSEALKVEKNTNADKDKLIEQLTTQLKDIEHSIETKQLEQQLLKTSYEERVKSLETESKALKQLKNDESIWRRKYEESVKRNEHLLNDLHVAQTQCKTTEIELKSKKAEIEQKDMALKKLKNTNKILQDQCAQMDKQAEQFKTKYVGLGEQRQQILADKESTLTEVQKLNKELENMRNKLKSELKAKEDSVRRLEVEHQEYQLLVATEKQKLLDLKTQFEEEIQKNREYEERISVQEQNLYSNDEYIINLDSKMNRLEQQLIAIKEEAAKHITNITTLKESNHKLTIAFEDSLEKQEVLQQRIDSLHNQLDLKEEESNRERITSEETINQQLKLIDFLQNKVQSLEKQKKPLFSITPTKKSVTNSPRVCPLEFKDLDKALAEEKTKNRRLTEELNKTKSDANYYRNAVKQLKNSIKSDDLSLNYESNQTFRKHLDFCEIEKFGKQREHMKPVDNRLQTESQNVQRMHHNIPHRFTEITNKLVNSKCVSCADTIHFGRKVSKCSECGATTHHKCAQMLPNNCGLPVELMQQLFHSSHDVNDHYYSCKPESDVIEVHVLEPSAPEAHSFTCGETPDSSGTTDNNESDSGAVMSNAMETNFESEIREIEAIYDNKVVEEFSFSDSMLEILENENKS